MRNRSSRRQARHEQRASLESITAFSKAMNVLDPAYIEPLPENAYLKRVANHIAHTIASAPVVFVDNIRNGNQADRDLQLFDAQDALAEGVVTDKQIQVLVANGLGDQIHVKMSDNWSR